MNMLLSLPQQSPKGELFGKFCDCLVRRCQKLLVESHRPSAKYQGGSFHVAVSSQVFIKDVYVPHFADKLLFVSFQQNKDF